MLIRQGTNNKIGGRTSDGNVIGFNEKGISVDRLTDDIIRGNYIGVNRNGERIGNLGPGIFLSSYTNNLTVGYAVEDVVPAGALKGNRIAFNQGGGIELENDLGIIQNSIRGNQIYDNGGIGIDLNQDDITINDVDDSDTGANELQNYPDIEEVYYNDNRDLVIFRYTVSSDSTIVSYPLTIDFYLADSQANGQGKNILAPPAIWHRRNWSPMVSTQLVLPSVMTMFLSLPQRMLMATPVNSVRLRSPLASFRLHQDSHPWPGKN